MSASVNEVCEIFEEGKASLASDIDVVWLKAFGVPRLCGGLMYRADTIGVANVYCQTGISNMANAAVRLIAPAYRNKHLAARSQAPLANLR